MGTQVAGHDDQGVLEVHHPALAIGETAVVQYLQQHVEHIRVGLFDFIEQDHGIRMTPYSLRQLAAFFIPYIAGRRTDQTGNRMFLHVFTHIDPDDALFIIEQHFGQGFGQFGLAHARRPQENEGADGFVGILDAWHGPG